VRGHVTPFLSSTALDYCDRLLSSAQFGTSPSRQRSSRPSCGSFRETPGTFWSSATMPKTRLLASPIVFDKKTVLVSVHKDFYVLRIGASKNSKPPRQAQSRSFGIDCAAGDSKRSTISRTQIVYKPCCSIQIPFITGNVLHLYWQGCTSIEGRRWKAAP
jgi:hypothetical protein